MTRWSWRLNQIFDILDMRCGTWKKNCVWWKNTFSPCKSFRGVVKHPRIFYGPDCKEMWQLWPTKKALKQCFWTKHLFFCPHQKNQKSQEAGLKGGVGWGGQPLRPTTFCLIGGSLNSSKTPYFHKGGPLRMVPMLPWAPKYKEKNFFFFKQLYLGN